MQLDKTYIAIRERDFMEIIDLSLHVVKRFAGPLLVALLCGIVPLAVLTHLWVYPVSAMSEDWEWMMAYSFWVALLAVLTAPLAGAPATLLLGQALFMDRPSSQRIARDFFAALPQFILFQIVVRGLMAIFFAHILRPYMGEIVLLERNPLTAGRDKRITTTKRCQALHAGSGGELFSRWLSSMLVGVLGMAMLMLALWGCTQWISETAELDRFTYAVYFQFSVWMMVGLFTVVRFLSYLDLRIRREGWEVELKMRAEAARLQSELA